MLFIRGALEITSVLKLVNKQHSSYATKFVIKKIKQICTEFRDSNFYCILLGIFKRNIKTFQLVFQDIPKFGPSKNILIYF